MEVFLNILPPLYGIPLPLYDYTLPFPWPFSIRMDMGIGGGFLGFFLSIHLIMVRNVVCDDSFLVN